MPILRPDRALGLRRPRHVAAVQYADRAGSDQRRGAVLSIARAGMRRLPAGAAGGVCLARGHLVPTDVSFHGTANAARIVESYGRADLLLGNNLLAHVPDLNDFVAGMKMLLKPGGATTRWIAIRTSRASTHRAPASRFIRPNRSRKRDRTVCSYCPGICARRSRASRPSRARGLPIRGAHSDAYGPRLRPCSRPPLRSAASRPRAAAVVKSSTASKAAASP